MPQAARALGHVYIEGLGTKQDIPRAERYYKFVEEKAGYTDREYWFWVHYGVTLRQMTVPEKNKNFFKESLNCDYNANQALHDNYRTCLSLVRERFYVPVMYNWNNLEYDNNCDVKTEQFFWWFKIDNDETLHDGNRDAPLIYNSKKALCFFHMNDDGQRDDLIFYYK